MGAEHLDAGLMDTPNAPDDARLPEQDQPPHPPGSDYATSKAHRCHICNRTYERRDHLSRHIKSHNEERTHICHDCGKGFHRGDLLTRHRVVHVKDVSADSSSKRTAKACASCIAAKTKCTEDRPCDRCKARNEPCLPTQARVRVLDKMGAKADALNATARSTHNVDSIGDPASKGTHAHDMGLFEHQNASYAAEGAFDDFVFPDFFDQIMNVPPARSLEPQEPLLAPPNLYQYTADDFGLMDFDFGLLAHGLTRPPSPQDMRGNSNNTADMHASPHSDAHLRSEAFEKSPWSWGHWIPKKHHNTFSGQEIIAIEQRINAGDQLTPGDGYQLTYTMDLQARDRILRLVTSIAAARLPISSFPSPELLSDLVNVFALQEQASTDSYVHWPSLNIRELRTETILGILAKGATFVALQPVHRIGLVFQEIVRLAIAEVFEQDNSTTRQLQPLQAYMLSLDVGLWSGYRRKTEIASSFLQPAATMLSWSDAFTKFRYQDIEPSHEDDAVENERKWKMWVEQESLKRLVLHTFLHDSQASLAHTRDPLFSPSRMQLPFPLSAELWQCQDAESWRRCYRSIDRPKQSQMPSVVAVLADIQILNKYSRSTDQRLSTLLACHLLAYDVMQYRQQATVFTSSAGHTRRDRWLAHTNRQKEIYEDLTAMHTYCEMMTAPLREGAFLLHYLMMLLHAPFEDIQLFSGRSGESEARRVYPMIKAWAEDAESRTAIWHAGQALRAARMFEKTRLRDFYAVIVHHVALTLWVYGMVTSNTARMSGAQSPAREQVSQTFHSHRDDKSGSEDDVLLDGEDGRLPKAFRHLGQGRPCLSKTGENEIFIGTSFSPPHGEVQVCPLEQPKSVMLLAAQILEGNFPKSTSGLPPLVDNLAKLMAELSRFSGRGG